MRGVKLALIIPLPISVWNNCFIKDNQEILLALADFALQEQTEDNFMAYTMAAKPIKSLELHYTMSQFLTIYIITDYDTMLCYAKYL